jgi:hypothetical protein
MVSLSKYDGVSPSSTSPQARLIVSEQVRYNLLGKFVDRLNSELNRLTNKASNSQLNKSGTVELSITS